MKRWAGWSQSIRWLVGGVAVVALALAIAWVLFVPAADWLAHHDVGSAQGQLLQAARDAARGRLLTLGAGLFAAAALVYTARNYTLSRESQVTDRYTKAIQQLGSNTIDVTIGGIYALERIARDSPRDHPTVMEVLAACIREHSREQWPSASSERPNTELPERTTRPDVQAALTVIGRRNARHDRQGVDLGGADLTGANLGHANLSRANLFGANLTGAYLTRANLTGAYLARANLTGATLHHADLTGAFLLQADLTGALLADAIFTGAELISAKFSQEASVPEGWVRDSSSGCLKRAGTPAEDSGN
jgi:hypothetical protein